MFTVSRFDFNDSTPRAIEQHPSFRKKGTGVNWPVVYIMNNASEAYVGETVNASRRVEEHLMNEKRRVLTEIRLITDDTFNKSVILDLESFLIRYMSADGKFVLQNGNNGLRDHEYYERSSYEKEFLAIWKKLRSLGLVRSTIEEIGNSELFKYSPYKTLGDEQARSLREIVRAFTEREGNGKDLTVIVRGGAGTGKTILAVYLMKFFADLNAYTPEMAEEDSCDDDGDMLLYASAAIGRIKKIGIVFPQKSLQNSVREVFGNVGELSKKMVLSPSDAVDEYLRSGEKYDLLIVDEAHRLKYRKRGHLSNYRIFDRCSKALGMDPEDASELDWMLAVSRNQILFRDELQTVRPCDIDRESFMDAVEGSGRNLYHTALSTQFRCLGGNGYIDFLKDVFSGGSPKPFCSDDYDLRFYEDCGMMTDDISGLDQEYGLCRTVAGYAWKWNRKGPSIFIGDREYWWNRVYDRWITSRTASEEIGCIHTVQGYDLNYAGVIIGRDLRYDPEKGELFADKNEYYDNLGKSGVASDPEALREYIVNIYLTLLTRGIRGTFVYVCDKALRDYLRPFFSDIRKGETGAETSD